MSDSEMITISAILVHETGNAWLLNCDGDEEWFPKSQCEFDGETLKIPDWLYAKKFPNEEV